MQHQGELIVFAERGELRAQLAGRLLHEQTPAAVGDWVGLDEGTIRQVLPRRTAIVRNAAGAVTRAQVLVANVDVAFVLTSVGPDLEARRVERYLTAVWSSGATPVILLTKVDLVPDAVASLLELESVAIGAPVHAISATNGAGCDELSAYLRPGTTAVLLGSSGVGKSTLANRLAGTDLLRTNDVREDDGKGRHTTSHRQLVVLPEGGLLIDTPGLRELQLWDAGGGGFERTFVDIEELAQACRFPDCAHTREPDCAVLAAVDDGSLQLDRLRSYRKLERELRRQAARQGDARARAERRREIRMFSRSLRKDTW